MTDSTGDDSYSTYTTNTRATSYTYSTIATSATAGSNGSTASTLSLILKTNWCDSLWGCMLNDKQDLVQDIELAKQYELLQKTQLAKKWAEAKKLRKVYDEEVSEASDGQEASEAKGDECSLVERGGIKKNASWGSLGANLIGGFFHSEMEMQEYLEFQRWKRAQEKAKEEENAISVDSVGSESLSHKQPQKPHGDDNAPSVDSVDTERLSLKQHGDEDAPSVDSVDRERHAPKQQRQPHGYENAPSVDSVYKETLSPKQQRQPNGYENTPSIDSIDRQRLSLKQQRKPHRDENAPSIDTVDRERLSLKQQRKQKGDSLVQPGQTLESIHEESNYSTDSSLTSVDDDLLEPEERYRWRWDLRSRRRHSPGLRQSTTVSSRVHQWETRNDTSHHDPCPSVAKDRILVKRKKEVRDLPPLFPKLARNIDDSKKYETLGDQIVAAHKYGRNSRAEVEVKGILKRSKERRGPRKEEINLEAIGTTAKYGRQSRRPHSTKSTVRRHFNIPVMRRASSFDCGVTAASSTETSNAATAVIENKGRSRNYQVYDHFSTERGAERDLQRLSESPRPSSITNDSRDTESPQDPNLHRPRSLESPKPIQSSMAGGGVFHTLNRPRKASPMTIQTIYLDTKKENGMSSEQCEPSRPVANSVLPAHDKYATVGEYDMPENGRYERPNGSSDGSYSMLRKVASKYTASGTSAKARDGTVLPRTRDAEIDRSRALYPTKTCRGAKVSKTKDSPSVTSLPLDCMNTRRERVRPWNREVCSVA